MKYFDLINFLSAYRSGSHYNFILPDSPEELLAFEFQLGEVDWDDIQHADLLQKEGEDLRDFRVRRHVHIKSYELEYTQKQREHLLAFFEAINAHVEKGSIERQRGHVKVKLLEPHVPELDKRIKKLEKEVEKARAEYSTVVHIQTQAAEEKRLLAEYEVLHKRFLAEDDSKLPALRVQMRDILDAIDDTVNALQKVKRKRKKIGGDDDEEESRFNKLGEDKQEDFIRKS